MKIAKVSKSTSGHFLEIFLQISIDIEGQIKQGQDVILEGGQGDKESR